MTQYPIRIDNTEFENTVFGLRVIEHVQYDNNNYYNFTDIIEVWLWKQVTI
jgi:hypothetical protein